MMTALGPGSDAVRGNSIISCASQSHVAMTQGHVTSAVLAISAEGGQYLDHASDDELSALAAARGVQHVKAVLAVLAVLELEEDIVLERTEALGADKAAVAVERPVAVDNLRLWLEPILAARTGDAVQVHDAWHVSSPHWSLSPLLLSSQDTEPRSSSRHQGWPVARPA